MQFANAIYFLLLSRAYLPLLLFYFYTSNITHEVRISAIKQYTERTIILRIMSTYNKSIIKNLFIKYYLKIIIFFSYL